MELGVSIHKNCSEKITHTTQQHILDVESFNQSLSFPLCPLYDHVFLKNSAFWIHSNLLSVTNFEIRNSIEINVNSADQIA